jgi:hypothetical protein
MRPLWLIEAGVYGDEVDPLLREIRRQGLIGEVVPHQSLKKGWWPKQVHWSAKCGKRAGLPKERSLLQASNTTLHQV